MERLIDDSIISSLDFQRELDASKDLLTWGVKSNIPTLDEYIGDFGAGEVTVVSGVTGEGKTTLCRTLTRNFYAQGENSVWFSYEEIPKRFISQFGIHLPEFFLPKTLRSTSLKWIKEKIYEAKEQHGCRIAFVDHLHYLLDMAKVYNVSLQIGDIMRGIVEIAHEYDIHFFLIAHMAKVKPDAEPQKGDARDSSFVEQEPDNVFYIWRKKTEERGATLKIAKNRRNGVFNKKINLVKLENYLEEVDYGKNDEGR